VKKVLAAYEGKLPKGSFIETRGQVQTMQDSFVGLGVGEPAVSWGSLLAPIRQIAIVASAWWMVLPAGLVTWTAWSFSQLAHNKENGEAR